MKLSSWMKICKYIIKGKVGYGISVEQQIRKVNGFGRIEIKYTCKELNAK